MSSYKHVGDRLKEVRGKTKKSQVEFAKMLGVVQSTYSAYELGKKMPPTGFITELCEKTNTSADWILGIKSKEEIAKSRGDFIEQLIYLEKCGVDLFQIKIEEKYETLLAVINANTFNELFPSLKAMRVLEKKGVVPASVVETWLEAEISKRKNTDVQPCPSELTEKVRRALHELSKSK